jgi:WD40 repeat protein
MKKTDSMKKLKFIPPFILLLILTAFIPNNPSENLNNSGELRWVQGVAISKDGKYLVTGGYDQIVKVWNIKTKDLERTIYRKAVYPEPQGEINDLTFSPDGKLLAVAKGYLLAVRDFAADNEILLLDGHKFGAVGSVLFTSDSKYVISGGGDKTAKVWNLSTGKSIKTLSHPENVEDLALSADGKLLAVGGGNAVKIYDVQTWKAVKSFNKISKQSYNVVSAVAFSPDMKTLAVTGTGGFSLWNIETGLLIKVTETKGKDLIFSKDGKSIYVAFFGNDIVVLDAATAEETSRLKGHKGGIDCLALSEDGKMLASGSLDNTAKLWDLTTEKEIAAFVHSGSNNDLSDYKLIGTDKGASLYIEEDRGNLHFKVVNNSSFSVYVSVKLTIKCKSYSAVGGVSYDTYSLVKNMSVSANTTRSAKDQNNSDYVQGLCKGTTESWQVDGWTVSNN